ncbi:hypothetical protein GRJ2_001553600 [Grus japonensis]|uniref:Uncharacterized protein n=1 Tax=Grus japonensis TaxID=30415 RepID=A0ABC9WZK5_GRUJA
MAAGGCWLRMGHFKSGQQDRKVDMNSCRINDHKINYLRFPLNPDLQPPFHSCFQTSEVNPACATSTQ